MAEWLDNVVVGAQLEATDLLHLLPMGGEHDDGDIGDSSDLLEHFKSVFAGHCYVEDDHIRVILVEALEASLSVGSGSHGAILPLHLKANGNGLEDLLVIVDHQDLHLLSSSHVGFVLDCSGSSSVPTGIAIHAIAPCGSAESIPNRPPCSAAMDRTTGMPRPARSEPSANSGSTSSNRSRTPSAMPRP